MDTAAATGAGSRTRGVRAILWVAALAICVLGFGRAIGTWKDQIELPLDLVLESPSLATLELLRADRNPYAPEVYAEPPFWMTMYTPLYYQLVAALPSHPENPFFTGRIVDLACVAGLLALLFWVRDADRALAALGCGAYVLVRVVINNGALFKNDFLGILLSALAVVVADRARGRTAWIVAAALIAATAFWCKQSMLAAAAACGLFFLLQSWRAAWVFGGTFALAAGSLLGGALALWGKGFWFSVFQAPQNPLNGDVFRGLWLEMLIQPIAMLNLLAAFGFIAWATAKRGKQAWSSDPFALYAVISAVVLMATVGKQGAGANYFNEWEFASLLVLVRWVPAWIDSWRPVIAATSFSGVFLVLSIVEIAIAKPNQYSYTTSEITPHAVQFSADVSARITVLGGPNPKVLNLYSASITGAFPGEVHLNDPFLYALLWQAGKLDPERVFAAIRERTYDLVIVPPDMLSGVYNTPPDMLRPLRRNYAFAERIPMFDRAFDVLVRRTDAK